MSAAALPILTIHNNGFQSRHGSAIVTTAPWWWREARLFDSIMEPPPCLLSASF
jgi:hypothetical protein